MRLKRDDSREWFEGPKFVYRGSAQLAVNVTGSSRFLNGELAEAVLKVLRKWKRAGAVVLDFGAGSRLWYAKHILQNYRDEELFVVEYAEAFRDVSERQAMEADVTFWGPTDFVKSKRKRFDVALLINVLNTIPEEDHRRSVFGAVADRLAPMGRLLVYQRVWTRRENPEDAVEYGAGWIVPQPKFGYCTYRGRDGARWFKDRTEETGLREIDPGAETSSGNIELRAWEKKLDV